MYVGLTNDMSRRMSEHKSGVVPGFTRKYSRTNLVYVEPHESVLDARACETMLKRWRRAWNFALIEKDNPVR